MHRKLLLTLRLRLLLLLVVVVGGHFLLVLQLTTHLARVHGHIPLLLLLVVLVHLQGRVGGVVRGVRLRRVVTAWDTFYSWVLQWVASCRVRHYE